jgi:hypothetical protein
MLAGKDQQIRSADHRQVEPRSRPSAGDQAKAPFVISDQSRWSVQKENGRKRGAKVSAKLKAPRIPCGSCPYRKDVPSGIWERCEYDKLPAYDGPTWSQSTAVFLCHQRNGHLCGGWLACHGPQELLALRIARDIDPDVYDYVTHIPVFASGAEARAHGIKEIAAPSEQASRIIRGLIRKQQTDRRSP